YGRRLAATTARFPYTTLFRSQVELHPEFAQKELRAFHAELGIATQCWSPLGQGAVMRHETLVALAAKYGKSPAQVTLRWHVQNGDRKSTRLNSSHVKISYAVF